MGNKRNFCAAFGLCMLLLISACSGGGGSDGGGSGGGDSDSSDVLGPLKRTSNTGIRVIHGALDATPVAVRIVDQIVQSARFAQPTRFSEISDGPVVITVERPNAPAEVISQLPMTLEKGTEYTIFVSGMVKRDTYSVQILPEPIVRPETGFSRIRLAHSLDGAGALTLTVGTATTAAVARNAIGDYIDIPSGVQTVQVLDKNGGVVSQLALTAPDRGDLTVLVSGSRDYGVQFATAYEDLD